MSGLNEHLHGLNVVRATRGGKRPNSGRKKGEATVTLSYRVKAGKAPKINLIIQQLIIKDMRIKKHQTNGNLETEPDYGVTLKCIFCDSQETISGNVADYHGIDDSNFVCSECKSASS